jgi:hypothetical protein
MQLPSILEFKTMVEEEDYKTLFSWLLVVCVPVIYYSIYPNTKIGH